jgi:hypothetical protein
MHKWNPRKKIWIFATLGAMALLLLYPIKTTVVPDWKIRIVDEAGNPMRSFRVREIWQHYTIETYSHEEDLITDGDGYVTSLLVRIGWPMVNV